MTRYRILKTRLCCGYSSGGALVKMNRVWAAKVGDFSQGLSAVSHQSLAIKAGLAGAGLIFTSFSTKSLDGRS
jgi:hypothetical protein